MSRQHDKWNRSKRPSRVNVCGGGGRQGKKRREGKTQLENLTISFEMMR